MLSFLFCFQRRITKSMSNLAAGAPNRVPASPCLLHADLGPGPWPLTSLIPYLIDHSFLYSHETTDDTCGGSGSDDDDDGGGGVPCYCTYLLIRSIFRRGPPREDRSTMCTLLLLLSRLTDSAAHANCLRSPEVCRSWADCTGGLCFPQCLALRT